MDVTCLELEDQVFHVLWPCIHLSFFFSLFGFEVFFFYLVDECFYMWYLNTLLLTRATTFHLKCGPGLWWLKKSSMIMIFDNPVHPKAGGISAFLEHETGCPSCIRTPSLFWVQCLDEIPTLGLKSKYRQELIAEDNWKICIGPLRPNLFTFCLPKRNLQCFVGLI